MSYKGRYTPRNPKKYRGNHNNIVYRSLWELKFMKYCDRSASILEWGSEEIIIPYISPWDNRVHRYFPDFYIKYRTSNGEVKREIIEVKPKSQCFPPKEPKRVTKKYKQKVLTYIINQAKFKAAGDFCNDRKMGFRILTEDHLVPKKGKK